jgi:hypothetical protein
MCSILVPRCLRIGRTLSKASLSPPTMKVSVPLSAAGVLPVTGASRYSTPISFSLAATLTSVSGDTVEQSTTTDPLLNPSTSPSLPKTTCSTSEESGSISSTTSDLSATSFGDLAGNAPIDASSSTGPLLLLWTVRL